MTATVGRIVHVLVDPASNNGSDIAPAIITRVFSDDLVNYRILLDANGEPVWRSSAKLCADEAAARFAHAEWVKVANEGGIHGDRPTGNIAFWPARV